MNHSGVGNGPLTPVAAASRQRTHRASWCTRLVILAVTAVILAMVSAQPASAAPTPAAPTSTSPCGVATDNNKSDDNTDDAVLGSTDAGQSAIGGLAGSVGQFAISALCWTLAHIDISTSPELTTSSGANSWFSTMYTMFRGVGLWVMIPLLMMATIHSVFKGQMYMLLKIYLVYLPVAVVGGVAAVGLVQLLLSMTDDFSKGFANSISATAVSVFAGVSDGFGENALREGVPFFILIPAGLMLGLSCMGVYVILVLREATVYISTAFIPLSLSFLVWPSTAHFFKKLAEFLIGMILSKLIMFAGIALAVTAMASSVSSAPGGTTVDGTNVSNGGIATGTTDDSSFASWTTWLGQTMTTTVMFGIVMFSPTMMVKLLAGIALPNAGRNVADHHGPPQLGRHLVFLDRQATNYRLARGTHRINQDIRVREEWAASTSREAVALASGAGVSPGKDGSYAIDRAAMGHITSGAVQDMIYDLSRSQNPNDIAVAHAAHALGADGYTTDSMGHIVLYKNSAHGGAGEAVIVTDVWDRQRGGARNGADVNIARRAVEEQIDNGWNNVRVIVPYTGVVQDNGHAIATLQGRGSDGEFQEINARNITNMLADVNQRRGSNARLVIDATTNVGDRVNGANFAAGGNPGRRDY